MSPGFDYADFETGVRQELIAQYSDAADAIRQYTR
jgi:predicted cupin superfamily sugar epimerase